MFIANLTQALQEFLCGGHDAAFALNRLKQEACGAVIHQCARRLQIVERRVGKAFKQWRKTIAHLFLIGCRNRSHRPPVERVMETDQRIALRIARNMMIAACGLDRAFHCLGTRICKKDCVSEGVLHQPRGERFALWAAIQVRYMHQCSRLILDRLGQMRVAVAKQINCNPAGKIKIALTALTNQMRSFASHRTHTAPGINGHQRGNRHDKAFPVKRQSKKATRKWPPDRE